MKTQRTVRGAPLTRSALSRLAVCAVMWSTTMLENEAAAQSPAPAPTVSTTATPASPTEIAGIWQGTLMQPNATKGTRFVAKVTKDATGAYKTALYNADEGYPPTIFSSTTLQGANVKFATGALSIEGRLSADGKMLNATWKIGADSIPIAFALTLEDAAWTLPEPLKPMAVDADPSFEVATIKPDNSGATRIETLTLGGRHLITKASSLEDLISFAFQVQSKQIVNAPKWLDTDRYDIDALPDVRGIPSTGQLRTMVRKLMADRFQLKFHHEDREMPAYVLAVAKTGPKLTVNAGKGNLSGVGVSRVPEGITLHANNARMGDLITFLQALVLDRPVVDHTGLTEKYDLKCTFTPDGSQFNGDPPRMSTEPGANGSASTEAVTAAPSLYKAMQEQLGLTLTAEKSAVDVLVIDHVERPSPN